MTILPWFDDLFLKGLPIRIRVNLKEFNDTSEVH